MVEAMIRYFKSVENRMRDLEKREGIPTPVPVPGPVLQRHPALVSLLRRLTTLRTAAEGVSSMEGPMESARYGLPQADPLII